jgi:uncharacterized protein YndB with AHSA1/START domain
MRRTFNITLPPAWQLLTSPEGCRIWLHPDVQFRPALRASCHLDDGFEAEVTIFVPNSHLRMTWKPADWPRPSILQLRVIPNGQRTIIAFHQEHLPSARARQTRRTWFKQALARLGQLIQPAGGQHHAAS